MNNKEFTRQNWLASIPSKWTEHMNGGDISCAAHVQRFFVRTQDEADEAERRAELDPLLALELAREELEDIIFPDWTPDAWWSFDFDGEIARRAEVKRSMDSHSFVLENTPDVGACIGGALLVLNEDWRVDEETELECCGRHPLRAPDFHTAYCVYCNVDALRAEYLRIQPERADELAKHPPRYGDEQPGA